MDAAKIPASNCENAGKETCSGAPNHGNVTEAAPVVDAGHDSGVGHWEGDGVNIRFVKNEMSDETGVKKEGPERPGMSDRKWSENDGSKH